MNLNKITAANLVDRAAEKFGGKVFCYREKPVNYRLFQGDSVTFSDSLRLAKIVANALRDKLGVRKGDRIALALTNSPEIGMFFTAAARIGAIIVPFNYMLKADELAYSIKDCEAKVLVTEPDIFNWNIKDKAAIPEIKHWIMLGEKEEVPEAFISLDDLCEGASDTREPIDLDPDEVIAIFYTSGTTGFPKGAMLSSRNLLFCADRSTRILRIRKKDFGIAVLPIAHVFGFSTLVVSGLVSGASGYMMRFFNPVKVLEAIDKFKATLFIGVPAMYNMLLQSEPEKYDLSSMRYWFSGADAMPIEHIKQFEKLGGRFIEGYGLVETAPIVSVNLPFIRKPGSIGIPLLGVKIRIMDENGNLKKAGEVGEIVVRGDNIMKGYWNNPEATELAFKYGWFHTGDLGKKDRLGFTYFVDREKDVIKVSGYSVFSREVEEELFRNPKIHECAVVGEKDERKGEIPVAVIQLKEGVEATEEELLAWCKEHIASYRAPRKVKIVNDMPLTMTLKVLKRDLKKELNK